MEHGENEKVEEPEIAYTLKDVDRAKQLFAEGKRHFVCGNVAEAAKSLSEVCTIFAGYYGVTADECADPYYYFGRTLLELGRKKPNVAHAVEGVPLGGDDSESEEISNLQLSWEMLNLARVIWLKSNNDTSKQRLTDCRLALGEHAIEDGQFDKAVSELNDCLSIQKDILQADDRRIAVCYFNIGLAHSFNQTYDDAIDSFNAASAVLKLRRENLVKKSNGEGIDEQEKAELEDETKEVTTLIADIQNRVQDCVESRTEVTSKQELQKFESALYAKSYGNGDPRLGNKEEMSLIKTQDSKAMEFYNVASASTALLPLQSDEGFKQIELESKIFELEGSLEAANKLVDDLKLERDTAISKQRELSRQLADMESGLWQQEAVRAVDPKGN